MDMSPTPLTPTGVTLFFLANAGKEIPTPGSIHITHPVQNWIICSTGVQMLHKAEKPHFSMAIFRGVLLN